MTFGRARGDPEQPSFRGVAIATNPEIQTCESQISNVQLLVVRFALEQDDFYLNRSVRSFSSPLPTGEVAQLRAVEFNLISSCFRRQALAICAGDDSVKNYSAPVVGLPPAQSSLDRTHLKRSH